MTGLDGETGFAIDAAAETLARGANLRITVRIMYIFYHTFCCCQGFWRKILKKFCYVIPTDMAISPDLGVKLLQFGSKIARAGALLCARHVKGGRRVCACQTPRGLRETPLPQSARRPSPEHADRPAARSAGGG